MLEEIELEPLSNFQQKEIVSSCVQLMAHQQLDRDTLHKMMRVLVRLTKNYALAEVFERFGGVDVLLNMKQNSGFIGFTTLATLLIRHLIEEPKTLSLAIQNVLINRTLTTIPPGHRELLFLVRQLNSAVYRDPELFKEAALKVLCVDFDSMKCSNITDEKKFIMKSVPPRNAAKFYMEQSTAISAVCKLLEALSQPGIKSEEPNGGVNDKPLLNKSAILKILADSVKSYQSVGLIITEHIFRAGSSGLIAEDTSALSFILDKFFNINEVKMDTKCVAFARSLILSIASCNVPQAQETVVMEVETAHKKAVDIHASSQHAFALENLVRDVSKHRSEEKTCENNFKWWGEELDIEIDLSINLAHKLLEIFKIEPISLSSDEEA